jgi:integrase
MNEVYPIRNKRDITRMKKALHGRDLLLFIIGINTGLRVSDLLKLKVGDVRGRDFIDVTEQKTTKTKRLHFNNAVKQAVRELVPADASDDNWLFPSRKGNRPITRVQVHRILNDAAKRAGILDRVGNIGAHSLRKTFGYHAYKNGVPIETLMQLFNHSSQSVTLRYIGITAEEVADVYLNMSL